MRKLIEYIFPGIIVLLLLFIIASIIVSEHKMQKELDASSQVEQYCTVEDKYIDRVLVGKVLTRRYVLDVSVVDAKELRDKVVVSRDLYNRVEKGSEVKSMLFYTDNKLVNIEIIE